MDFTFRNRGRITFLFIAVILSFPLHTRPVFAESIPEIEIISPRGSETWIEGQTYTITWKQKDVSNVRISYAYEDTLNWIEFDMDVDSGSSTVNYEWRVPELLKGRKYRDGGFKAKIGILGTSSSNFINEVSSAEFFLLPSDPKIGLISPNGGEVLQKGKDYTISWDQKDISYVDIGMMSERSDYKKIADRLPVNKESRSGSYVWHVPEELCTQSEKFKILINGYPEDNTKLGSGSESENYFSIVPQTLPSMFSGKAKILFPNGGEKLFTGNSYTITWEQENLMRLYLLLKSKTYPGSGYVITEPISKNYTDKSGKYDWKVPDYIPAGEYKVYLDARTITCDPQKDPIAGVFELSDNYFYIEHIPVSQPVAEPKVEPIIQKALKSDNIESTSPFFSSSKRDDVVLLKTKNSNVIYAIINGKRNLIPNKKFLKAKGYNSRKIKTVFWSEIKKFPLSKK